MKSTVILSDSTFCTFMTTFFIVGRFLLFTFKITLSQLESLDEVPGKKSTLTVLKEMSG